MTIEPDSLKSVHIKRFKRINDATFDLQAINVLVGANNSGKSTVIQGLHFGIGLLQTIALAEKLTSRKNTLSTSLNPAQLLYSPAEDVSTLGSGGRLFESKQQEPMTIAFYLVSGDMCSIQIRKGRNRNILVAIDNVSVAQRLSSLERPFSIFSPGLAGIAKREEFVSDGVLLRALARGDANLVLRNILLRLRETEGSWQSFMIDLREIFPTVDLNVTFRLSTDEVIDVSVKLGAGHIPLEIAGTGLLQAIQILAYIHRFAPRVIVLDEPDSHVHPNNQRLLCSLLRRVAEERGTQVVLTTHSRHVVDAIERSCRLLWIRNGEVDKAGQEDEIGILLEIGALDVKERLNQAGTEVIVLTEDELTQPIEVILSSSGFDMSKTLILLYYGVTVKKNLQPLVDIIKAGNNRATIVVHRDRDFLYDEEVREWETSIRAIGVEPFVTQTRDLEACFINAEVLAEKNSDMTVRDFETLIAAILTQKRNELVTSYVNGRTDIIRKRGDASKLNHGELAVEAVQKVDLDPRRYAGKTILRSLRSQFQTNKKQNLLVFQASPKLENDMLALIARKVFGSRQRTAIQPGFPSKRK
jgi:ABC-type cobalamin/Fe3+-siderophores transport system ATPase subunit